LWRKICYIPDMRPHTAAMIKEMLAQAKGFVAEGEARLLTQETRVAKLEGKDREGRESRKLLKIMRDTQNLQVGHVRLLERELAAADDADADQTNCALVP